MMGEISIQLLGYDGLNNSSKSKIGKIGKTQTFGSNKKTFLRGTLRNAYLAYLMKKMLKDKKG